jgi:hypothetical protein
MNALIITITILICLIIVILLFLQAPALPIPMNFPTFSPTASQSPTAPTPKPTSPCTGNTPNWTDSYGDDCTWYEQWEAPGCPTWGMDEGEMGSAMDNCCFCKMG